MGAIYSSVLPYLSRDGERNGGNAETTTTPPPSSKYVYGWKRDVPDSRDLGRTFDVSHGLGLVDLRTACPPVYNQGKLGSCTAQAVAAAFEFDLKKQQLPDWRPSRLFIYYCERAREGTITRDSGAAIRDGVRAVNRVGVPHEEVWPYDIAKFAEKPPLRAFLLAKKDRCVKYHRVAQTVEQLRAALAAGYPVVFGFKVYESFEGPEVARNGLMPMPKPGERVLGGHAVMAVGYSDDERVVLVRNSWGPAWGDGGYFRMPYEFWADPSKCSDFWVLDTVEAADNREAKTTKRTGDNV